MGERRLTLADTLAARPSFDHLVTTAAGRLVASLGGGRADSAQRAVRLEFYVGAATLAALVLTAATFVCSMTYQSSNPLIAEARRRFGVELRRNWTAIIPSTLLAAVLPVFAIVIDARSVLIAMTIVVFSLALVVVRFLRSVYWLRYTLFMQSVSDGEPSVTVVRLPRERKAG